MGAGVGKKGRRQGGGGGGGGNDPGYDREGIPHLASPTVKPLTRVPPYLIKKTDKRHMFHGIACQTINYLSVYIANNSMKGTSATG